MKIDDVKQRKVERARVLFQFKCDRYRRWYGGLPPHMRRRARESAAAKYGIKPSDID